MTESPTVDELARAFLASVDARGCIVGKMEFWAVTLEQRVMVSITADDVDEAMATLSRRGKLKPVRNGDPVPTGKPLSGATMNRYLAALGSLHRWARRNRLIPRNSVSPTKGIEREREAVDPDRYVRAEDVEKLVAVARVTDQRWRRLAAFIRLGFTTGLRKGNLMALRWRDVCFESRTVTVLRTKNGRPLVVPLAASAVAELKKLKGKVPDELIFGNRLGKPFNMTKLWKQTVTMAGMPHVTPHFLRHGAGSALAKAGCNQAQIMAVLNHSTLVASQRYIHLSVHDKAEVIHRVFG